MYLVVPTRRVRVWRWWVSPMVTGRKPLMIAPA